MNFEPFIIRNNGQILDALQKIDENNKGFLIVINENMSVVGTLTDGDIRRAFIDKYSANDSIKNIFKKDFIFIKENDKFENVINIFKSPKINFLPVICDNYQLVNLITKKQFHTALIEDINFSLRYNFFDLDELTIDHEIYNRPWGFYKTTFLNPYARAKIITVYPNEEISLQEHKKREEHWVVISGHGIVIIGESEKNIQPGNYIYIPKGCKHKISNTNPKKSLMISEVQLGEEFSEDDIIRYEDKYGRN